MTLEEAFRWAAAGCQDPNCGCDHLPHDGPMYVHSRCHPRADVSVALDPITRTIIMKCGECQKPIMEITCP